MIDSTSLSLADLTLMPEETTSLGVPYQATGRDSGSIDLSGIRVFTGLSVIARMLGDEVLEQIQAGDSDVVVQRRIIAEITPELAAIGLGRVLIYARTPVLHNLRNFQEDFHQQIRAVFGTLQRPRWGSVLFPELFPGHNGEGPAALLFPFHLHSELEDINYFFLVERHAELQFLRITIEPEQSSRLDLATIPHVTVDDLERRTYLQGLTRVAETFRLGLLRECEERRTDHSEAERRHPEFFGQLRRAGLENCDTITFQWPARLSRTIVELERPRAVDFLKRLLLVLEDSVLVQKLCSGQTIEVVTHSARAFLDTSRLGRTLNVAFGDPRRHPELGTYLERMPALHGLAQARPKAFEGADVFLIHHITGEILAVLEALARMGAERITTLFVKYAGIIPPEYLEVLLSQPRERFLFYGLQRVESDVRGHYTLSGQMSPVEDLADLDAALRAEKLDFFPAMRLTAGHLFLRAASDAERAGRKMVLIEDGGYLGPELHSFSSETTKPATVAEHYRAPNPAPDHTSFGDWLLPFFPGSVEHTRNGYDRLLEVAEKLPGLRFPSTSIAVSEVKRGDEAAEVSVTVLHAIESILHGLGLVLSRRRLLVLGCRGAIGARLMEQLGGRGYEPWGIDVAVDGSGEREVRTPAEIPERVMAETDLVIGVIGRSILDRGWLESWLCGTRCRALFLASGSTKTLEFSELSDWLAEIERGERLVQGERVALHREPIRDPQTGLILGTRVSLSSDKRLLPTLYLLGDLTPINFLYYGVPTETMDAILTQLVQLGAGIAAGSELPPGIYALDREIDPDCRPLAGSGLTRDRPGGQRIP